METKGTTNSSSFDTISQFFTSPGNCIYPTEPPIVLSSTASDDICWSTLFKKSEVTSPLDVKTFITTLQEPLSKDWFAMEVNGLSISMIPSARLLKQILKDNKTMSKIISSDWRVIISCQKCSDQSCDSEIAKLHPLFARYAKFIFYIVNARCCWYCSFPIFSGLHDPTTTYREKHRPFILTDICCENNKNCNAKFCSQICYSYHLSSDECPFAFPMADEPM